MSPPSATTIASSPKCTSTSPPSSSHQKEAGLTFSNVQALGKSDAVISLLRHLPYIKYSSADFEDHQGAPSCRFADWREDLQDMVDGNADCESLRITSEQSYTLDDTPAHVIGLTSSGRNNECFMLDTELGIVYWPECPGDIRNNALREAVHDCPYDYALENEADWRGEGVAWAIADFFEVLRGFVPLSSLQVLDVYTGYGPGSKDLVPMVQQVFRRHGWPDLERYNKRKCLAAVKAAVLEHYPGKEVFFLFLFSHRVFSYVPISTFSTCVTA